MKVERPQHDLYYLQYPELEIIIHFSLFVAYISIFLHVPDLFPMVKSACFVWSPRQQPGVLVFDNKDIHLQATYIWVKAWVQNNAKFGKAIESSIHFKR